MVFIKQILYHLVGHVNNLSSCRFAPFLFHCLQLDHISSLEIWLLVSIGQVESHQLPKLEEFWLQELSTKFTQQRELHIKFSNNHSWSYIIKIYIYLAEDLPILQFLIDNLHTLLQHALKSIELVLLVPFPIVSNRSTSFSN